MASIDQQFVEYIVKSLVSNPDEVEIKRTIDEKGVLLELTVAGEDLGRVIGKRGSTAQSIRSLLRALGTKNDARYNLKIIDTGEGMPAKPVASPAPVQSDSDDDDSSSSDDTDDSATDDEETNHSSVVDKTRAELADLDDLDV